MGVVTHIQLEELQTEIAKMEHIMVLSTTFAKYQIRHGIADWLIYKGRPGCGRISLNMHWFSIFMRIFRKSLHSETDRHRERERLLKIKRYSTFAKFSTYLLGFRLCRRFRHHIFSPPSQETKEKCTIHIALFFAATAGSRYVINLVYLLFSLWFFGYGANEEHSPIEYHFNHLPVWAIAPK